MILATDSLFHPNKQTPRCSGPVCPFGRKGLNLLLFPSITVFYYCFAHSSAY